MSNNLRTGQMLLVKSMETQPLEPRSPKGKFKAAANGRMVMMYLATIDENTVEHFSADGALLSIGYGPQMFTAAQRRLIDALIVARAQLNLEATEKSTDQVLQQIDEALAGVKTFDEATAPKAANEPEQPS